MTLQSIAEFLAMPIVRKNRVPRLATAIQRLGLSAATAAHVILTCRFPVPGEYDFSREIIRCAFCNAICSWRFIPPHVEIRANGARASAAFPPVARAYRA